MGVKRCIAIAIHECQEFVLQLLEVCAIAMYNSGAARGLEHFGQLDLSLMHCAATIASSRSISRSSSKVAVDM